MPKLPTITADVEYRSVTVRLRNRDGFPYWAKMTEEGVEFYSAQSSSGRLESNPVMLSGAEIFEVIAGDGKRKEFAERAVFKRPKA